MPVRRTKTNPLIGTLKTYTFTPPPVNEIVLGSAATLPTTEPATGQYVYTIQQSDMLFPGIISPKPIAMAYTPVFSFSGKTGSTASTISYRVLWNGASLSTGTSPSYSANTFWTFNFASSNLFNKIAVGDTVELRFWSNVTDANYSYSALCMYPARPVLTTAPVVKNLFIKGSADPDANYKSCAIGASGMVYAGEQYAILQNNWQGNPGTLGNTNGTGNIITAIGLYNAIVDYRLNYHVPETGTAAVNGSTSGYNIGSIYYGDSGLRTTYGFRNDSTRTYIERNHLPLTISFRELWI